MKKIIYIIFILINSVLAIKYGFSLTENILLIIMMFAAGHYFLNIKNIGNNVFELFLVIYILCSVQLVCIFELKSNGFFKDIIEFEEYRQLAVWGTQLLTIIFLSIMVLRIFCHKRSYNYYFPNHKMQNQLSLEILMKRFLIFIFCIQLITFIFGLASNYEEPAIVLPFHLNGLIDSMRSNWVPFILCVYIFDTIVKKQKINREILILYILYAAFEVLITSSKSVFVMSFIPALVLLALMNKLDKKMFKRTVIPLMIILLISYPIIEGARQEGAITIKSLTESAKNPRSNDDESKSSTYIRSFLTGIYYIKLYPEINKDYLQFDFSQIPLILICGGGSGYMTKVIDKMPEEVHHSSGITGLGDALIWGGYPLCYIITFLLTLVAVIGDSNKTLCKKPLYKVILFMWFYGRIVGTTMSYIIEPLFFSDSVSIIVKIFIVKYYYLKFY